MSVALSSNFLNGWGGLLPPPQIAHAVGDGSRSGVWTNELGSTSDLYLSINDTTPGDLSDYVQSPDNPAAGVYFRVVLDELNPPMSRTAHVLRVLHGKSALGGRSIDCIVDIREGTDTLIARRTLSTTDMETLSRYDEFILTSAEASSIANYADVRIEFNPTSSGGGQARAYRVFWTEFETPAGIGQVTRADTALATDVESLSVVFTESDAAQAFESDLIAPATVVDSASATELFWLSRIVAVPPNQVVSNIGVTISIPDVDEDPDSPDASWAVATGDIDAVIGFADAPGTLTDAPGDQQEIRIRLRPGS